MHRSIEKQIESDLQKKFVFLSGPRQVGKSTLAKDLLKKHHGQYLLYDDEEDRRKILQKEYVHSKWVCLDEFHKFPRWKAQIKGVYDKYHESLHLLLTGSARLDVFQKSGDSLFGRYYLHHLHPFSLGELDNKKLPTLISEVLAAHEVRSGLSDLMKFGGFPEPLFSQSEKEHRRWSNARRHLLVREDMRELAQVNLLGLVEQLMLLLPDRIGSIFSYRSLAEDIRVAPQTIQNWLDVFEKLFLVFKLSPYSKNVTRAIQKQPKYYLYDWSQIGDEGRRFENCVASHLWKAVQTWNDLGEADLGLHFVRDRDHREVDFLVTKDRQPWFLIEAKTAETRISDSLKYFCRRLEVPGLQLLLRPGIAHQEGNIMVLSAERWLAWLP